MAGQAMPGADPTQAERLWHRLRREQPTPTQLASWSSLAAGRSVVLRAPTGSGKTEALALPLLAGDLATGRLTYVLPMRTLADQLGERLDGYGKAAGLQVAVHHGEAATVRDFPPPALVTTIDQAVTAYAAAPLSSPIRWGHVLGGHIAGSFLVFDEVHLLEPDLGLQAALLMAEGARSAGSPVGMATATLPTRLAEELATFLDGELLEGEELFPRSVVVGTRAQALSPEDALRAARAVAEGVAGALVFCNTVDKAQALYQELRGRVPSDVELLLAHSRFLPEDRRRKEQALARAFGREGHRRCVAITTSVAEVGLDISAELVLTDICPADALVQRAGRCVRWGGQGRVEVFVDEAAAGPYDRARCTATAGALPETLGWAEACALVDAVFGDLSLTAPDSLARVAALIDEGSFSASRHRVHEAVRELDRAEVTVWEGALPPSAPRVPVAVGVLRRRLSGTVARVRADFEPAAGTLETEAVEPRRLRAGDWVVLPPTSAGYEPDLGLRLSPGSVMGSRPAESPTEALAEGPHAYGDVPWVEHCRAVLEAAERSRGEVDGALAVLRPLLEGVEHPRETLLGVLALHDLGKLSLEWQAAIGRPEPPLSHFGAARVRDKRPPHATTTAAALERPLLALGPLGRVLQYVLAHHHRARAAECPPYRLHPLWKQQVESALAPLPDVVIERLTSDVVAEGGPQLLSRILPVTRRPQLWVGYLAASRLLVLLDRRAVELRRDGASP